MEVSENILVEDASQDRLRFVHPGIGNDTLCPNLAVLLVPTMIFGVAHGLNIPSLQTSLTGLAPMRHRAAFMSINGTVLRLGQTLGPMLMGLVFVAGGLDVTFYVGAGFAVAVFALLAALMR